MLTPKYSTSQFIGHLGSKVFFGGCPDNWFTEGTPQQGGDFGFDASMWLGALGQIAGRFSVQIKAGAGVTISGGDSPYIAVELTPQVCNLYLQDGNPVLLAFVVLKSQTSSESAEMYYVWIKDELRKRLGSRAQFDESDPENMTIQVPLSNAITKQLDITEYLKEYWDFNRVAALLKGPNRTAVLRTISALTPSGAVGLAKSEPNVLSRWLSNESMAGDNLWPVPKQGTTVATLRQLSDQITHGNLVEADRLVSKLQQIELDDADASELKFQEGRRSLLENDIETTFSKFSAATVAQPSIARYYAAQLEAGVMRHLGDISGIGADLLARAKDFPADTGVQFQLARIAALGNEYERAQGIIDGIEGPTKEKAKILHFLIRGDLASAGVAAAEALTRDHNPQDRFFLNALRLRISLNVVLGTDEEIPIGGKPGLSTVDAIALRDQTKEFLRTAQNSGWPSNSELALDCAAASCAIFGFDQEIMELIYDFSKRRPALAPAKETLVQIAMLGGEPDVAIRALKEIPNPSDADLSRLALLLNQADKHSEAMAVALRLLDCEHSASTDAAVAMGAISAYRLGSTVEETKLCEFLFQGEQAIQSLYRFISQSIKAPNARDEHLNELWKEAKESGDELLYSNLMLYLSPDRNQDLERIIEATASIAQRRGLTQLEASKRTATLLRLERFDELIAFTDRVEALYPTDENIGLAKAIVLDKIGQTPAALEVLRKFESSGRSDLLNAHTQLLLRTGDVDAAIGLVKQALSVSSERKDRFYYSRILATIYSRIDRQRYLESVVRLGQVVDQEVEEEEGVFLVHFLMATSGADLEVGQAEAADFQRRAKKFSAKFPESGFFRIGTIPEQASGNELIAHMQRLAGITEEVVQAQLKARVFGERSGSHVPFPYRPRAYAPYASNIVDLLGVAIYGGHRGESSRIIAGDSEFSQRQFKKPPILDLTTVFALVELDIFDKLFSIWTGIAIPKESLAYFADLLFEPLPPGNRGRLQAVADALKKNSAKIVQPGLPLGSEPGYPVGELATIRAEISAYRYEYLTIDLASAVTVARNSGLVGNCRTLWDLIHTGELKGAITGTEASLIRLRVASWNSLGVPLEKQDIGNAALGAADLDPSDRGPSERAVVSFVAAKPLASLIDDIASVIVELAQTPKLGEVPAASWVLRILYRELVLMAAAGFTGNSDNLTAHLAVMSVKHALQVRAPTNAMQRIWRVLDEIRCEFGGTTDKDQFYNLLGTTAANLFDKIVKKHGIAAIAVEADFRELLFSMTSAGTQDRGSLEKGYFERTTQLQNPSA